MATKTQQSKQLTASRSLTLAICSFIVTTLISAGTLSYTVWRDNHQMKDVGGRLGKLEAALRILTATVAPQLQHEVDETLKAAALAPVDRADKLAESAQTNLKNLRQLDIPIPQEAAQQLTTSTEALVESHPDSPSSWNVATQLVSYRTDLVLQPSSLPNCFDIGEDTSLHRVIIELTFSNCRFDLGDVEGAKKFPITFTQPNPGGKTASGTVIPSFFLKDVLLIYRGGATIPFNKIECQNCRVDFSPSSSLPPPTAQQVIRTLLASDPSNFSVMPSKSDSAPKG
jgi:hypothetical protein